MFFAFAIHGSGEIYVVACRTRASTGQSGLSWFLLNKGAGTMPSSDCRLSACSADALTRASATLTERARHPWRGQVLNKLFELTNISNTEYFDTCFLVCQLNMI